jgi:hypothetical protein
MMKSKIVAFNTKVNIGHLMTTMAAASPTPLWLSNCTWIASSKSSGNSGYAMHGLAG